MKKPSTKNATAKSPKTTTNIDRAIPLRPVATALAVVPPMKPPPVVVTLEDVTGTCETGDVLESLHDEIRTLLLAANSLLDGADDAMGNLLPMALRKVEAAAKVYAQQHDERAAHAAE